MQNKKILVAPLNWGMGHATRCIPVIEALENHGYEPVIASDGVALELLKKEFPDKKILELPSYKIEYAKNGSNFKLKMFFQIPNMIRAVKSENKAVKKWIKEQGISGIISDNRMGVYAKNIPSVFMTHQLNVLTGNTTWLTTQIHRIFIKKHKHCWVPDVATSPNLTGKLGHPENCSLNIKYIGPISRLNKKLLPKKYDLMVILSGPEPQRTLLEEKLKNELPEFDGEVLFVRGVIESEQTVSQEDNITYYNFMNTAQLEKAFNESEVVLCRSGYTTVMDLAKLGKKAFFIPTPGQYEQEYLAKKLQKSGLVPYALQDEFKVCDLEQIENYKGLKNMEGEEITWKDLFSLFESE